MEPFIQFLLTRGKISEHQARLVENILESSSFFGVLAMRENMVTPEQLEKVILEQYHGRNKRIGEILVEEGIMTEKEVAEILDKQTNVRSSPSRIMVDLDILDAEEVAGEEKAFSEQNKKKPD